MFCNRCKRDDVEPHPTSRHLCVDCVKAENNRVTYYRQHQDDWLAVAKESGLDPWLQQPGETQWEYTIWSRYRDSYPGKRPTYGDVARELDTTYGVVSKVSQRWTFPVRMQLWMRFVDQTTMVQRKKEILDMNKEHIDMAKALNGKLSAAIEAMDPLGMKPSEVASLLKTAAELERKARLDTESQEEMRRDLLVDPEQRQTKNKANKEDLSEIVDILSKAGVLGELKIKKTTTTTTEVTSGDNAIDVDASVSDYYEEGDDDDDDE